MVLPLLSAGSSKSARSSFKLKGTSSFRFKKRITIKSEHSGKALTLTPKDLKIIRRLWKSKKKCSNDLWNISMFRVIDRDNVLRKCLGVVCRSKTGVGSIEECEGSFKFEEHVQYMQCFWELVLQTILANDFSDQAGEKLVEEIREIAKKHSTCLKFSLDGGTWLLLKTAVVDALCPIEKTNAHDNEDKSSVALNIVNCENNTLPDWMSWNKVVMFVISEMKHAYLEEVRYRFSTPQTSLLLATSNQTRNIQRRHSDCPPQKSSIKSTSTNHLHIPRGSLNGGSFSSTQNLLQTHDPDSPVPFTMSTPGGSPSSNEFDHESPKTTSNGLPSRTNYDITVPIVGCMRMLAMTEKTQSSPTFTLSTTEDNGHVTHTKLDNDYKNNEQNGFVTENSKQEIDSEHMDKNRCCPLPSNKIDIPHHALEIYLWKI